MFLNEKDSLTFDSATVPVQPMSPGNMTLQLLYSALAESASENRLIEGTANCIELLSRNPNKVLVCILPVDESGMNVNVSIQLTLIESICQEYNIPIVKVDKIEIEHLLSSCIMNSLYATTSSKKASEFISDLDCCFIESQENDLSASEKKLMNLLHDIQDGDLNNFYADFPK